MFAPAFKVKSLGAAPAFARATRAVRCRGVAEEAKDAAANAAEQFKEDAKDSIKPRVEELRNDKLQGTTGFERALRDLRDLRVDRGFKTAQKAALCDLNSSAADADTRRRAHSSDAGSDAPAAPRSGVAAFHNADPTVSARAGVMAFSGAAPELVNGRLAMLGFFAAMSAELTSQDTAVEQFMQAPQAVLGVSLLFIVASIIPIVRGTNFLDSGSGEGLRFGAFNVTNECAAAAACAALCRSYAAHTCTFSDAAPVEALSSPCAWRCRYEEAKRCGHLAVRMCRLINGRAAMVGLTIMLFQEAVSRVPTFGH